MQKKHLTKANHFWLKKKKKKTPQKVGIEGTYLNIIKAIYDKAATNIIPKDEKLKEL